MRVAVLGAGLQGACVAMELASHGVEVDLYDKNERCLTQASAQNEGKIHLGYVYAKDPTLNTARLMIRGAATFSPLMRRWIGTDIDKVPVSAPFHYAVHKDSLIGVEGVQTYLSACNTIAQGETCSRAIDYFGEDYRRPPTRVPRYEGLYDPETIVAVFETPEVSIDPEALASHVRARLASEPKIHRVMRAHVLDVVISDTGADVGFDVSGERFREGYDHVVNTLWDGRLAIDARAGIRPARPWLFRIRHFLRGRTPPLAPFVPSTTIVLGPFGDVVKYPSGDLYLSWYPAGMRGVSSDLRPPKWPRVLDERTADRVRRSTLAGLIHVIPALADLSSDYMNACEVKGGVIFGWGSTDITDPVSGLHTRANIGPFSFGRYHSIDTGKLTTAPLFAQMVAKRIRAA
jgi:glycine/D-amino acid oxidase-like deaminating enzyme